MQPPSDITAERGVLGACLIEREAILAVSAFLSADDFSLEKHAQVYAAIQSLADKRIPPDMATVADELRRQNRLDGVGGMMFLGELAAECITPIHAEYYAQIVQRTAILRRLIRAGGEISALGYDEAEDLEATIDAAEQKLFAVLSHQRQSDFVPLTAVCDQILAELYTEEPTGGIETGWYDLDAILGGLRPGNLVILGGRPGSGKTAVAVNLANELSVVHRKNVGFVSLEMGASELVARQVALHTGLDTQALANVRKLSNDDKARIVTTLGTIADAPMWIDDTAAMSLASIRSKARRLSLTHPLDLLIVDYLQLATVERRVGTRSQEVDEISRGLKALARELRCPVLALAQLNRAVEGRTVKVPTLADLRESGQIEQDADVVLFTYRPDLYDKTEHPGTLEIHVAKHRNGPLGTAILRFEASTTAVQNLSKYEAPEGY